MVDVLVLADDLTGALEVGAQFARRGARAIVSVHPEWPGDAEGSVLVVNTDSRHLPPTDAAARCRTLAEQARALDVPYLYKKTDSTLRGNIGAELAAMLAVFPDERLVFVPAYPTLGRTCEGGHLLVHGRPLRDTPFAADPLNPVHDGFIPDVLGAQTSLPVHRAPDVAALRDALTGGTAIIVCDGREEHDLAAIADLLRAADRLHLTAGTGGFAEHLARAIDLPVTAVPSVPSLTRILCVCGSVHAASLAQVRAAWERGIATRQLTPEQVLGPEPDDSLPGEIAEMLGEHARVILATADSPAQLADYRTYALAQGLTAAMAHARIVGYIGTLVRQVVRLAAPDGLVVLGGDTAQGILRACGCAVLTPQAEVLPGVPVSQAAIGGQPLLTMATKAGGFGDERTLIRILDMLMNQRGTPTC